MARCSLVPARPGAQALGALQARLVLEAALARRARGFGGLTRFRGRECAADQVAEPLLRLAAVVLLGAVIARDDEDRALGGEAPPAQGPEARLDGLRERRVARARRAGRRCGAPRSRRAVGAGGGRLSCPVRLVPLPSRVSP